MRIIGGEYGGRLLGVPKGFDVRPTPDLVRQALFNSLSTRPDGAVVLELFGGSGALSLECLSRGAVRAVCVEKAKQHARYIESNARELGVERHRFDLRLADAFVAMRQLAEAGELFDLILADPPYGEKNIGKRSESFAQMMLDDPSMPKLLRDGGLFVLGHSKRDTLSPVPAWTEVKLLKHGDSLLRFFEKAPEPAVKDSVEQASDN